jgi:purine nucleosidase
LPYPTVPNYHLPTQNISIILDTDIGDDIDDAFALNFALNSPEVDIIGITTVYRNARKRAGICAAIIESLGKSGIPIHAGIDLPLKATVRSRKNDRYDENGVYIPCQFIESTMAEVCEAKPAVEFLIDTFRANPQAITLVPIGPLTNIATAILVAPDIVEKIKEIVLMGGSFGDTRAEWNILCDPEAADVVFSSGVRVIKAIGLDVTMSCQFESNLVQELSSLPSQGCRLLTQLVERWQAHYQRDRIVLHDALTIAALTNPTIIEFSIANIAVGLSEPMRGVTLKVPAKECVRAEPVLVATKVDAFRFLRIFQERVFAH